jgi:hypothetical protein
MVFYPWKVLVFQIRFLNSLVIEYSASVLQILSKWLLSLSTYFLLMELYDQSELRN